MKFQWDKDISGDLQTVIKARLREEIPSKINMKELSSVFSGLNAMNFPWNKEEKFSFHFMEYVIRHYRPKGNNKTSSSSSSSSSPSNAAITSNASVVTSSLQFLGRDISMLIYHFSQMNNKWDCFPPELLQAFYYGIFQSSKQLNLHDLSNIFYG
jgi:hypothetical protein